MDHSIGVYVGKRIWISTYNGNVFCDREGSHEAIENISEKYVTSDKDPAICSAKKETALAYYAYSHINKARIGQKRVYEIICGNDKAEMFVYEGFEGETSKEVLHQTEQLDQEESEKIIVAKRVLGLFINEFPEDKELELAQEKVKEYVEDLISGEMCSDHESVMSLIDNIYNQIDFMGDTAHVELNGNRCSIKKSWYTEGISREVADSYIPVIRKLVGQINNNLEKNDIFYVFIGRSMNNKMIERQINEIAQDMFITIKVEPFAGELVSRGNAFRNYLVNHIQRDRIQKHIGSYAVEFDGYYSELDYENGKISLTNQNDFSNCYSVQIKDLVNSSTNLIKMYVPFSTSGTLIEFTYSYEAAGLYISIKDCKCEEEHTETIKYID